MARKAARRRKACHASSPKRGMKRGRSDVSAWDLVEVLRPFVKEAAFTNYPPIRDSSGCDRVMYTASDRSDSRSSGDRRWLLSDLMCPALVALCPALAFPLCPSLSSVPGLSDLMQIERPARCSWIPSSRKPSSVSVAGYRASCALL